jgi:hypothetical protein
LLVREAGTGLEEFKSEKDLLDAFLTPADDGSTVVVAITGDSGVGKSHMIRWLHAQLQRNTSREKLVIVLVPKTASLRQVVELMLEGTEYDTLRQELGRVTDSLGPGEASRHLATTLTIELEAREAQWIAELKSGNTNDRSLRERALHARGLKIILFQVETFDNWLKPVLLRIVKQALQGGSESSSGDARRFVPEDFVLPESFDITTVSPEAQRYIQQLQGNDGAATVITARVLQDVLDPALRSVFRFSEALGQRSLEEIVNDIRARLLSEGKELVLLIEDFAALAGIQETLLSLMISESDTGGKRVRAPLRTALAVTDGFLPSRQTILTRAKREWVIPNVGDSEAELINRLTRMAGRYLNAARWGIDNLREQFKNSQKQDLYSWVRPFTLELDADEQDSLDAFGKSDHDDPLFPLSPLAVDLLVRREMTVDGKLLFNPRKFINSVLRDVLLKRELQLQGNFPPPHFKNATLKTDADLDLRSQGHSQALRDRLVPTLAFWGGDPRNLITSPLVSEKLFKAFGLPWPFQNNKAKTPKLTKITISKDTTSSENNTPSPVESSPKLAPQTNNVVDIGTSGLESDLEAWANGALVQARANRLRTVLSAALSQRMDWNSMRMSQGQIKPAFFWLPYAQVGNPTGEPKLIVAQETRPVPATIRRALMALDRWEMNGSSWNYPRAEDDYAYAQALLDQLEQQARQWFMLKAEKEAALLGRTLHRQSLLLGLSRHPDSGEPQLTSMLAKPEVIQIDDGLLELVHVGQIIALQDRAKQSRDALRKMYLGAVACFQGDGPSPHAIDATRVSKAWKTNEQSGDLAQVRFEDVPLSNSVSELTITRLPSLITRYSNAVKSLRPKLVELTGADFDASVVEMAKLTINKAIRAGVLPNQSSTSSEISQTLDFLGTEHVTNFVRKMNEFQDIPSNLDPLIQLSGWCEVDLVQLAKTHQLFSQVVGLVTGIQRETSAQLLAEGGADVVEKMKELISSLRSLKDAS